MATNTVNSFTDHTGNGTAGPFNVSFSYLSEAEVDVTVGGVLKNEMIVNVEQLNLVKSLVMPRLRQGNFTVCY